MFAYLIRDQIDWPLTFINQCFDEPYQCNHLKLFFQTIWKKYVRKMPVIKLWLYENDIVCFVLKGSENLHARGHKTEINITLASLGYIKSTHECNWSLLIDKTSLIYRNVKLKATARDFFFSCRSFWINSTSYEHKNRSASKGAQFIPMGIPTDYWKNWPPPTT